MYRSLEPCYVYVDGAYVRTALQQAGQCQHFDPRRVARWLDDQYLPGLSWTLLPLRFFYYDALDEDPQTDQARADVEQARAYFDRLRQENDMHMNTGTLRRGHKKPREQKGVDVQLAVDALEAATAQRVKAIVLISGDADFAPLAAAIRRAGPHVIVLAFRSSLSSKLRDEADRVVLLPDPPPNWSFQ